MTEEIHTMSANGNVSLSGVMMVVWMRNLSLHFVLRGGSSLSAWSITRDDALSHFSESVAQATYQTHRYSPLVRHGQSWAARSKATKKMSPEETRQIPDQP